MSFSTVQFLFAFLPLALAGRYLLPRPLRFAAMAAFSVLSCLWSGGRATLLLAGYAVVNWALGLWLDAWRGQRRGHVLLRLAVLADLAPLCLIKYSAFFASTLNSLLPLRLPEDALRFALPLGLSFYTFQAIGYCLDVWARRAAPQRSLLRFFLFLAFFAHLPSGPIVRYDTQAAALQSPPAWPDAAAMCWGIKRFIFGLAKKTLIADQLYPLYHRAVAVPAATLPGSVLLLGYAAFAMYLYFDFSGYSDMAVGLGALFGLPLPENFDYPYLSRSIGEFWRRWHITLGAWFRDYVYIPLGGSRCGLRRTCLNTLLVFALTGLWHGPAWHYVAFGLFHGLLICAERLFWNDTLAKAPRWAAHVYVALAAGVSMVLFGAPGLREALAALWGVVTWQAGAAGMTLAAFAEPKPLLVLAAGILLCGPLQAACPRLAERLRSREVPGIPLMALLFALLFLSIMRATAGTYNAFIYAQF